MDEASANSKRIQLNLLGGFRLVVDDLPVVLPDGIQRVVAFVALQSAPVRRGFVAGSLWLDKGDARAAANLRSSLWRLHQNDIMLLGCDGGMIGLGDGVEVDVRSSIEVARAVIHGIAVPAVDPTSQIQLLERELLPDWYEDWVIVERERVRQLRLSALEALASMLIETGRAAQAIDVGMAVLRTEPLRESAHRLLVDAHLAVGNRSEALRQVQICDDVLRRELGVPASESLWARVAGLHRPGRRTVQHRCAG